jgi:hypothetical protein
MLGYAAAGDTWGIPGQTFLLLYGGAAIVIIIGTLIHRNILFSGTSRLRLGQLGPQEAAVLNGGERLAVYTSLGALRPKDLVSDQWVRTAAGQLRERLERDGLAVTGETRRAARTGPLLLVALAGIGVARLLAGFVNGKPVGFLFVVGMAVIIAAILLSRVPRQTHAAATAVNLLRQRHKHLAPRHHPAYSTYGASDAAMGVALFGAASMWSIDPEFAREADLERTPLGDGGSASSGGSSCGGGGGGTSCSGASSCGGGGGSSCGGGGGCGG